MSTGQDDLLAAAKTEAEAILQEAKEQARLLMEAAERKRLQSQRQNEELRSSGYELAEKIEKSIGVLNQVLEDLRAELE